MQGLIIGFIVCVICLVGSIFIMKKSITKSMKPRKLYYDALQRLMQDPNNTSLREEVLRLGKKGMKNPMFTEFEKEQWMIKEIDEVCGGKTVKVEVTNPQAFSGKSVAQQIEELKQLFLAGVITSEEYERGKTLFLGAPPDKAAAAVKLLQNLDDLRKQGVLSESEFRMKKWDILSERLLPGKGQAAKL